MEVGGQLEVARAEGGGDELRREGQALADHVSPTR